MSQTSLPKVTIALPTINRLRYLKQSLPSALAQTYENLEVIVSDNCSTDGTQEYLGSLRDDRLTVLRQATNLGMIGNWNAILEKATGEFFLLLSDDDLLEEQAIEKLVAAIVEAPEPEQVGFAYCRGWVIDQDGEAISFDPIGPPLEDARSFALQFFSKNREVRPCATLLRTGDIREIGGYRQGKVVLAVDAIVWSRTLQKRRTVAFVSEPLAKYRFHGSNTSSQSTIRNWQSDLRILADVWIEDFRSADRNSQRRLRDATRGHQAWMIAVTINQSAKSYLDRLRLLRTYASCGSSFVGVPGKKNLVVGLMKLLVPETIKKPIRDLLIWKEGGGTPSKTV